VSLFSSTFSTFSASKTRRGRERTRASNLSLALSHLGPPVVGHLVEQLVDEHEVGADGRLGELAAEVGAHEADDLFRVFLEFCEFFLSFFRSGSLSRSLSRRFLLPQRPPPFLPSSLSHFDHERERQHCVDVVAGDRQDVDVPGTEVQEGSAAEETDRRRRAPAARRRASSAAAAAPASATKPRGGCSSSSSSPSREDLVAEGRREGRAARRFFFWGGRIDVSYFFWRASFFFFPRPSRSMPFALSLFSSLSTCERQKDVNSLCLVAVRASDQHVAAEGHEVEGRAGHLVVGERERATERTEDASRTDASRRREQGLSLGEVCLSPCSFVTAERGKRRPGALLWRPVRAPVEARRARAKLKRLPLSVSQERFFPFLSGNDKVVL